MHAHCVSAYPHECCGALIGHSDNDRNIVSELRTLRNAEPNSPERRFVVDPQELNLLDRSLRASERGETIVGFYHSHPDSPARPSSTDLEWAWEGYSYIIVSVEQGKIAYTFSYRLDAESGNPQFVPEMFERQ